MSGRLSIKIGDVLSSRDDYRPEFWPNYLATMNLLGSTAVVEVASGLDTPCYEWTGDQRVALKIKGSPKKANFRRVFMACNLRGLMAPASTAVGSICDNPRCISPHHMYERPLTREEAVVWNNMSVDVVVAPTTNPGLGSLMGGAMDIAGYSSIHISEQLRIAGTSKHSKIVRMGELWLEVGKIRLVTHHTGAPSTDLLNSAWTPTEDDFVHRLRHKNVYENRVRYYFFPWLHKQIFGTKPVGTIHLNRAGIHWDINPNKWAVMPAAGSRLHRTAPLPSEPRESAASKSRSFAINMVDNLWDFTYDGSEPAVDVYETLVEKFSQSNSSPFMSFDDFRNLFTNRVIRVQGAYFMVGRWRTENDA